MAGHADKGIFGHTRVLHTSGGILTQHAFDMPEHIHAG
ncbi:hypothetical protein ANO14919_053350 [Xylariales sp. No.14919]|nr:hypothetical protein ANO14919_053350 [Xylariales sp. No.14919]